MAHTPPRVVLARDASDDIGRLIASLPPSQLDDLPTFNTGEDAVWHLQHSLLPVFKSGTSQAQIALRFIPAEDTSGERDPRAVQEDVLDLWAQHHEAMADTWEEEGIHVQQRLTVHRMPRNIWTMTLYSSLPEHSDGASTPVHGSGRSRRGGRGVGVLTDVAAGAWATGVTSTTISPSLSCLGGGTRFYTGGGGTVSACLQQ